MKRARRLFLALPCGPGGPAPPGAPCGPAGECFNPGGCDLLAPVITGTSGNPADISISLPLNYAG